MLTPKRCAPNSTGPGSTGCNWPMRTPPSSDKTGAWWPASWLPSSTGKPRQMPFTQARPAGHSSSNKQASLSGLGGLGSLQLPPANKGSKKKAHTQTCKWFRQPAMKPPKGFKLRCLIPQKGSTKPTQGRAKDPKFLRGPILRSGGGQTIGSSREFALK